MKTVYSIEYVNRNPRLVSQVRARLQERTGVRWVSYTAHGKVVFHPTWTGIAPSPLGVAKVRPLLRDGGKTFMTLVNETGLSLPRVLAVSLWLCKVGEAYPIVSRTGEAAGIRSR